MKGRSKRQPETLDTVEEKPGERKGRTRGEDEVVTRMALSISLALLPPDFTIPIKLAVKGILTLAARISGIFPKLLTYSFTNMKCQS